MSDLIREGQEQRNCVAIYAYAVADGRTYIYRVESPVRGTLSIRKTGAGWKPDEFVLACDKPVPTEVYWAVVSELLQSTERKPKRQPRQEDSELSPYFQALLFDDDEEV